MAATREKERFAKWYRAAVAKFVWSHRQVVIHVEKEHRLSHRYELKVWGTHNDVRLVLFTVLIVSTRMSATIACCS